MLHFTNMFKFMHLFHKCLLSTTQILGSEMIATFSLPWNLLSRGDRLSGFHTMNTCKHITK